MKVLHYVYCSVSDIISMELISDSIPVSNTVSKSPEFQTNHENTKIEISDARFSDLSTLTKNIESMKLDKSDSPIFGIEKINQNGINNSLNRSNGVGYKSSKVMSQAIDIPGKSNGIYLFILFM